VITLRFVTGNSYISALIRKQAGLCMPFTPSHVEALSRDGKSYVGQHMEDGMQARPIGYDAATMLHEKLVPLPVDAEQAEQFYRYIESKIGQPYDWKSIVGFIAPDLNLHDFNHLICSAIMVAGLRACGYFPMPLTVPFHHISPRDLMLILSSHVQIDH
jgi:hypothetical protein